MMDCYHNYKGLREPGDELVDTIDNVEIFQQPDGKFKAIYFHEDGDAAWSTDDLDTLEEARACAYEDIASIDEAMADDYRKLAKEELKKVNK